MWLTDLLDRNRRCFGDRVALADGHRELTWTELDNRAHAIASELLSLGLRHGDRVVIASKDRAEVFEACFGLARIGAAFVLLNPDLAGEDTAGTVRRLGAAAVIGESAVIGRGAGDGAALGDSAARSPFPGEQPSAVLNLDDERFASLGGRANHPSFPRVHPDDVVAIVQTSATTGSPKGVVWDHRGLMQVCLGWLAMAEPTDDMVLVNCSPLSHSSIAMSFTYMAAGAQVVLMPGFTPSRALHAIERHRATHIWLVPEMLRGLTGAAAAARPRADTSSLREIIYGAAPMPWHIYTEAARTFGCGFRQAYGMAEAGGHFAMLAPAEHPAAAGEEACPGGMLPAGRPLPGTSVRICSKTGSELTPGEIGEIWVRSDSLMRGYWDDPGATAETMRDGWLRTADLGLMDGRGCLRLSGRLDEMIVGAGRDLYPAEAERVLRSHAGIADAAVVGMPDDGAGEVPVAYVVACPGQRPAKEDLMRLVTAELGCDERPVSIDFLDDLPRNQSGKVLKRNLRRLAARSHATGGG